MRGAADGEMGASGHRGISILVSPMLICKSTTFPPALLLDRQHQHHRHRNYRRRRRHHHLITAHLPLSVGTGMGSNEPGDGVDAQDGCRQCPDAQERWRPPSMDDGLVVGAIQKGIQLGHGRLGAIEPGANVQKVDGHDQLDQMGGDFGIACQPGQMRLDVVFKVDQGEVPAIVANGQTTSGWERGIIAGESEEQDCTVPGGESARDGGRRRAGGRRKGIRKGFPGRPDAAAERCSGQSVRQGRH